MHSCGLSHCRASFEEISDLVRHLESHRIGYFCENCGSVTNTREQLEAHLEQHRVFQPGSIVTPEVSSNQAISTDPAISVLWHCSSCGIFFSNQTSIEEHYIRCHNIVHLNVELITDGTIVDYFQGSNHYKYFCPRNSSEIIPIQPIAFTNLQ